MPRWLVKQLMRAFNDKDRRQIKFLNQCWFHFRQKERS
ncbi:cortex morphogenetic protein CmpA [Hazenella coriacea]|nr:cortex morphogenetic protein CmpA [Hazenella coriacea]